MPNRAGVMRLRLAKVAKNGQKYIAADAAPAAKASPLA